MRRERFLPMALATIAAFCILMTLLVVLRSAAPAYAHRASADSVNDKSGEIRWVDHTGYDNARGFGIRQWHQLGRVSILRDSPDTVTDLRFEDYRDCGTGVVGYWQPGPGADLIGFNRCRMNKFNRFDKRAVATHEVGHALSLAHPSRNKRWRTRSIMYFCPTCTSFNTPRKHDKADYRGIW